MRKLIDSKTGRVILRTILPGALLVFFTAGASGASETPVAWQENFDQSGSPSDAKIFYEDRGSGKTGEAVIINEVKGGILRYGLKYDPTRKQDRLNILFGDCIWWPGLGGEWGPFTLKDYPFLEVKWRGESFEFWYGVETATGQKIPSYTWLRPVRKETDAQGREWNISILRIAPDSSVPTTNTPVRLLGMNICPYSPMEGKDLVTEIDYIKVRGFTAEEAGAEKNVIDSFTNFPKGRWRGMDSFFPFGVYCSGYLRNDFESWCGDYEGAHGIYARHYFNFEAANDEVELGRFQGQASEEKLNVYLIEMNKLVESARANGMKLSADIRRMMDGRNPADGYQQIMPITKKIVETFPDDDTVVSWAMADEPSAASLISYGMMIRAMRESDPLQRPELFVFNNHFAFTPYSSYLQVGYWDRYPVLEGSRDPWAVRETAREYRKIMPDQPMWAVLPAFEGRPPTPKGFFARPTGAEIRLMAYLTLAEGVKGLVWYSGWMGGWGAGSPSMEGMVYRTGNPRGNYFSTLKELARQIIPVGQQLLSTNPLDDVKVEVNQPDWSSEKRGITASVLKNKNRAIYYLVVINEDLEKTAEAEVKLPPEMLGRNYGVYDLYALDNKNLLVRDIFKVGPLSGGDGRIYLVADEKEFQRQANAILCKQALEDVRVLSPDLTIARRWGLAVQPIEKAIEACRTAADKKDASETRHQADLATRLLNQIIMNHSELSATRRALAEIALEIDEVSRITEYGTEKVRWWTGRDHPMLIPNPGFLELSKCYWTVGRSYRDLYIRYLKGDTKDLWEDLNKTRMESLKMREDVLTMLRQKLQPAQE